MSFIFFRTCNFRSLQTFNTDDCRWSHVPRLGHRTAASFHLFWRSQNSHQARLSRRPWNLWVGVGLMDVNLCVWSFCGSIGLRCLVWRNRLQKVCLFHHRIASLRCRRIYYVFVLLEQNSEIIQRNCAERKHLEEPWRVDKKLTHSWRIKITKFIVQFTSSGGDRARLRDEQFDYGFKLRQQRQSLAETRRITNWTSPRSESRRCWQRVWKFRHRLRSTSRNHRIMEPSRLN